MTDAEKKSTKADDSKSEKREYKYTLLADQADLVDQLGTQLFDEWPYAFKDYGMNDARASIEYYKTTANRDKLPVMFVASDGDKLVGSAGLDIDDMRTGPYADKTPWMVSVWTHPDHRKQGIAAKLIRMSMDYAKTQFKTKLLWLWTPEAHVAKIYANMGWKYVEDQEYCNKKVTVMNVEL